MHGAGRVNYLRPYWNIMHKDSSNEITEQYFSVNSLESNTKE